MRAKKMPDCRNAKDQGTRHNGNEHDPYDFANNGARDSFAEVTHLTSHRHDVKIARLHLVRRAIIP